MTQLLSPRQIARALAVSESSVKRWCDSGAIPTEHTTGGHRRVPLAGLVTFLRESDRQIADPAAIGLVTSATVRKVDMPDACARLTDYLVAGDEAAVTRIAGDLLLAKRPASEICDRVFATVMHTIGERWESGEIAIYQERRACEIVLYALRHIETLLPKPKPTAPLAIGGAPSGDQYAIPNAMARLVLRSAGWRACSLGENLPLSTLAKAVHRESPRLVWLSCAACPEPEAFLAQYSAFAKEVQGRAAIVVGGRALVESVRKRMTYATYCDTMEHLSGFLTAMGALQGAGAGA